MLPRRLLVLLAAVAVLVCTVIGAQGPDRVTAQALDGGRTAALVTTGGVEPAIQAARSNDVEQALRKVTRPSRAMGLTAVAVLAVVAVAMAAGRRRTGWWHSGPAPALAVARVTPSRGPPRLRLPAS